MVSLRPVTRENVRAVCELELADHQHRLVAPASFTVAEGHYEPGALLRAMYSGEEPAGVLLVEVETGTPYLVRFMVDAARQRQGIGRQAVELVVEELREQGWTDARDELPARRGRRRGLLAPLRLHRHRPHAPRRAGVRPRALGSDIRIVASRNCRNCTFTIAASALFRLP